jgi:hypothetical protein
MVFTPMQSLDAKQLLSELSSLLFWLFRNSAIDIILNFSFGPIMQCCGFGIRDPGWVENQDPDSGPEIRNLFDSRSRIQDEKNIPDPQLWINGGVTVTCFVTAFTDRFDDFRAMSDYFLQFCGTLTIFYGYGSDF